MNESLVIVVYNVIMLALVSGALFLLWALRVRHAAVFFAFVGVALVVLSFASALFSPLDNFGRFQLLAWAMFAHCPLFLVGGARLLFRQTRVLACGYIVLAAGILLACVDAFLVEPHWLEVTRTTIYTPKLQAPVRVAVIADLQTDHLGDYEERVFRLVVAEQPDLILLAGDYLHLAQYDRYVAESASLNEMLQRVDLDAPLGVYAVRGNVDWPDLWREIFAGLPVTTFETSATLDLGSVVLTGLTLEDSTNTALSLDAADGQEKFHIVLGHIPNFSLGQVNADLLVAGHTHGGQVQVPFMGPILTLSQVPRSWASGVTTIAPGKVLVVSRGIGMERGHAPRLRFLCRPELVILDLVPSSLADLPEQSFDLAFVFGLARPIGGMEAIWTELHQCLKPQGILAVEGRLRPPDRLFQFVKRQGRIAQFEKIG
jgi:predicted MPP superfamily phosphohydrolase